MNELNNKRIIIVGLFVFIGIILLVGGILIIGNLRKSFESKIAVTSYFDDVAGLQEGNNVWLSGVKIGTVSKLEFSGNSRVEVRMLIDTKAKQYIPKDAKVKISSDGFIGNKILIIYGGTPTRGIIAEGDTLLVERTFSSEDVINTLQENNQNILAITNDIKKLSSKLVNGEGSIGKLLNDNSLYANVQAAAISLERTALKAQELTNSLAKFSSGLNKEGTLANSLMNDTTVFGSVRASVEKIQQIADTASLFIANLKKDGENPNSSFGILLRDEKSGSNLKETIRNLYSSSKKLDEDLEAIQHNILFKRYFKKKAKSKKSDSYAKNDDIPTLDQ
jgi:phospholipid/cholesterol/gamma-HCH transport system substrate-binding protein